MRFQLTSKGFADLSFVMQSFSGSTRRQRIRPTFVRSKYEEIRVSRHVELGFHSALGWAFPFTDGGVSMDVSSAKSESFGKDNLATNAPIYFAGPKVHLPDGLFDATVGIALLNKRTVTFDFKGMRFSLT